MNRTKISSMMLSAGCSVLLVAGCRGLTGSDALPAGAQDASQLNNPSGAVLQAKAALNLFRDGLAAYLRNSGLLTDEFRVTSSTSGDRSLDSRQPQFATILYGTLQRARGQAEQARGVLVRYGTSLSPALRGQMYAVEGYTDILLADFFCSGVPLSTIEAEQDFTYKAGSSTTETYRAAASLFDTAVALSADSIRIQNLARIGWGRALLEAGLFDSAAHVVAPVVDSVVISARFLAQGFVDPVDFQVSNREGLNGLPFASGEDPRSATTLGSDGYNPMPVPSILRDKLSGDSTELILASGVEARLIEAEAELRNGGTQWLSMLNRLRTDSTTTVVLRTNVPGVSPGPAGHPDTTWGPGTGIYLMPPSAIADVSPQCEPAPAPCTDTTWYRGLAPLKDPGIGLPAQAALDARVNLLFRERAFWLFASGHRQGDLRRLLRQYGRIPDRTYPSGLYAEGGNYGTAVWEMTPNTEQKNPFYKGCLSHE